MMCFLYHGVTTSKVIWHHMRIGVVSRRIVLKLIWVINVLSTWCEFGSNYMLGVVVCLVNICDWWIIYLLKIVGDNLVNMRRCAYVGVYYEPWNIMMIDYSCLYISITIDVKLTPVVVRLTAYLFVWMGRRHAGLVWLLAWWVAWG